MVAQAVIEKIALPIHAVFSGDELFQFLTVVSASVGLAVPCQPIVGPKRLLTRPTL
jgi:hypothetical protein